jgi:hypothetical protein
MEMNKLFSYDTVDEIVKNKELSDYDIYTDITPEGILIETSDWNLFQNEKITWNILKELIYNEILDFNITLNRDVFDENIESIKKDIGNGMDIFIKWDGKILKDAKDNYQYILDNEMWYIREVKNKHVYPFEITHIHYEDFVNYDSTSVEFIFGIENEIGENIIHIMYNKYAIHLFESDVVNTLQDINIEKIIPKIESKKDFTLIIENKKHIRFTTPLSTECNNDFEFICQIYPNGYRWVGTKI